MLEFRRGKNERHAISTCDDDTIFRPPY